MTEKGGIWDRNGTINLFLLGCGNVLLEDDGFGPAVAQQLQRDFTIPSDVCVLDTGTSVREILFDTILADKKPSKIVIIDAMDCGLEPGELFNMDIDSYPKVKLDDFSLHQVPTSNLLRELRDLCGIEVVVVACQVAGACDSVNPGLSEPVSKAVGQAVEMIAKEYFN